MQIQIFEALAGAAPKFGHHNLLTDASGEGLSKRTGALSIASLREAGSRRWRRRRWPCWSAPPKPCVPSLRSTNSPLRSILAGSRTPPRASTRPNCARCPPVRCTRCRSRPPPRASLRSALRAARASRSGWPCAAISPSLRRGGMVGGGRGTGRAGRRGCGVSHAAARPPAARAVGARRPGANGPSSSGTRPAAKGANCFIPLRLALTGRESGPELAALLPLIGRARASARLSAPPLDAVRTGDLDALALILADRRASLGRRPSDARGVVADRSGRLAERGVDAIDVGARAPAWCRRSGAARRSAWRRLVGLRIGLGPRQFVGFFRRDDNVALALVAQLGLGVGDASAQLSPCGGTSRWDRSSGGISARWAYPYSARR